jgi:protein-tyrosine sulfotransferase
MVMKRVDEHPSGPPIFVLSPARSGSTLMRYIIDTHPEICSPAELQLGELSEKLYLTVNGTLGQICVTSDDEERERIVLAEVRRVISELMGTYTKAKGKRLWCEKTPWNLQYLELLSSVFPDAKYICLYRNCMDVVHSCVENIRLRFAEELFQYFKKHQGDKISGAIDYWCDEVNKMLAFEREHGAACFRLKYESLVLEPAQTLEPLFGFLGVEWDPGLLTDVFSIPHDQGYGDPKIMYSRKISKSSIGKGSTISRAQIPEPMLKKMNTLLAELGYPVVGPGWDHEPSPYLSGEHVPDEEKMVSSVEEVFKHYIPRQLEQRKDALQKVQATYKIIVTGPQSGVWMINLSAADNCITQDNVRADCTIRVSSNDLLNIVNGRLNVASAFDLGRLQVMGNSELADVMGQVLFGI